MRNMIAGLIFGTMLFSAISSLSCASLPVISPLPPLDRRILEFAADRPALYFNYRTCASKFLWVCTKTEDHRDYYDLTDPAVRKTLRDAGFAARVWEKPE